MTIELTRGYVAQIDDEDIELVGKYKWHTYIQKRRRAIYAESTILGENGKRRTLRMHRLILGEEIPQIDHKDGDGLNNRRSNLRPANSEQNSWNRSAKKGASSDYKGVYEVKGKKKNKWIAQIYYKGNIKKYLGTFDTQEEAAWAFDMAARERSDEFMRPNLRVEGN